MSNRWSAVLTQIAAVTFLVSCGLFDVLGWIALAIAAVCVCVMLGIRFLLSVHSRERLYQPLQERQLPRLFRRHIEQCSPEMERIGLAFAGDFLIYPEPMPLRSRAFISDDGRSFGFIAAQSDIYFYGFLSVFEDGTYFESSPMDAPAKGPAPGAPIRFSFHPNASIAELFELHRAEIARIEEAQQTRVLEFAAEQYAEVGDYGHRLAGWDLYHQGLRWTPPKPARAQKANEAEQLDFAGQASA